MDPFRPTQHTPIPNFFLAGSYTAQVYYTTPPPRLPLGSAPLLRVGARVFSGEDSFGGLWQVRILCSPRPAGLCALPVYRRSGLHRLDGGGHDQWDAVRGSGGLRFPAGGRYRRFFLRSFFCVFFLHFDKLCVYLCLFLFTYVFFYNSCVVIFQCP